MLAVLTAVMAPVVTRPAAAQLTGGTFQGLGDLPGGVFFSEAAGVSADGSTVVGFGNGHMGLGAFRWTLSDGMVGLGDLPGGSYASRAFAVSADGSTIVGRGVSASGPEAFRWTRAAGMLGLGDLPGGIFVGGACEVAAAGETGVGGRLRVEDIEQMQEQAA